MRRPIDFKALREQIRPEQILRPMGWLPTDHYGLNDRGPCLLCEGDERRKRVLIVGSRVVKCLHCGFFGDALALYCALVRAPVYESAIYLCQKFQIPVPYIDR